jgi:ketosteroid isomerase-like protein
MSKELITKFYQAFQKGDGETMASMYHPEAKFSDEAFKNLTGAEAGAMWNMLLERSKGELNIEFHTIEEANNSASCVWEAKYPFSKTGRKVHNVIHSKMTFEDGKISDHLDTFNFWKWSRMALGTPGILLGWSPIIRNKVQGMARKGLDEYIKKNNL